MVLISYEYSVPYIALFLILVGLGIFESRAKSSQKKYIGLASTTTFILFIGFRGYVGWDWYYYQELYNRINIDSNTFNLNPNEVFYPGFIFFLKFLKTINSNFLFVSTTITVINSIFYFIFFNKYRLNVSIGFALISVFCLNIQIDLLRNSLSLLIFLFSIRYIDRKKIMSFLLCNLLGATIHLSSLLFIPLYFVFDKNWNNRVIKFFISITSLLYFLRFDYSTYLSQFIAIFSPDLSNKFEIYSSIETYLLSEINIPLFTLKLIMVISTLTYYNSIINYDKRFRIFLNLLILHFICFTLLSGFSVIQDRLSLLFVFSYVVVLQVMKDFIRFKKVVVTGFIFFQSLSIGLRYKSIMFEYNNYLFQNVSLTRQISKFENYAFILNPIQNQKRW